jgi:hypothetical protein
MPKRIQRTAPSRKPLWVCPKCGRQFASVHPQHSCGNYKLDDHFANKSPVVRELFDLLLKTINRFGPVTAHALKSRIVLQAETQFAAVTTRKHSLECYFWLKRKATHPLIHRIEMGIFRDYGHVFRLAKPEELDEELAALIQEAYVLGN